MPLAPATLETQLGQLFAAPPPTSAACAQAWAAAVQAYAAAIVPASATVTAAAATLASALSAAFQTPAAAPGMETAFAAFAATVGGGMAGYAPTPPPAPVGFATQFAGPFPATHADAASQVADLIHAWLTTGTGTLIAPPFTVVPWS